ncbi:LPP20 family lipoprotein [Adhaeribacter soli]|uniref:Uncharacterized protein n=1 Tax=Adhaeribacter soli TaxID=2607655 RepID=A0A5N1J653_9BACT|nr:LPP20 family lipoprotein [Adhaeribacter soli]KAA9340667.1 hypothetical protein F0P94_04360 [Adhaeribacter soli]
MKKSTFFMPLIAATLLFTGTVNAQSKLSKAKNNAKLETATASVPAADLAGIVDNTPKDDTPLEKVLRDADPIIEKTDKGSINWTSQYVEATGISILDTERFKNAAQARVMATRGAVVDAQRNLLETIKGVQVTGETTVENFMTTSDKVTTKVEGVIKGAYMVGNPRTTPDGAIEVTMRVPLYAKNGIASAVIEEVPATIQEHSKQIQMVSGGPEAISEAGPLQATPAPIAANAKQASAKTSAAKTAGLTTESGKPIVFNLDGKAMDPSMFPVIFDQKGEVALDMSKLYDPNKGQFPKILQSTKDVMKNANFKKGVEIIDLIQDKATGQLKLADTNKAKINWGKIGNVAGKVASFLLLLI